MARAKKPRKLAAEELFEYAVKALASRAHSVADLNTKLRQRAAHLPDIEMIIARLKDVGYLDDNRYAESFASARFANEGFGRMRILTDLAAHRVPRDLAQAAADKALDGRGEEELIQEYIERRMASVELDDEKKLASAFRKLRRAGYSTGPVLAVLKRRAKRPEMVDDFPDEEEPAES
jgi:regulatory protein